MPSRHPSDRKLRKWVAAGGRRSVTEHIADCDRCSSLVEGWHPPNPNLTAALADATAPAHDLEPRMAAAVTETVRNREALEVFADLFGLGWHTGRAIIEGTPREDEE